MVQIVQAAIIIIFDNNLHNFQNIQYFCSSKTINKAAFEQQNVPASRKVGMVCPQMYKKVSQTQNYFGVLLHNQINQMTQKLPKNQQNRLDISSYLPEEEEHSRALSYSLMAAEIDQEERLSQMSRDQPEIQQHLQPGIQNKFDGQRSERIKSSMKESVQQNLFDSDNRYILQENQSHKNFLQAHPQFGQHGPRKMSDNTNNMGLPPALPFCNQHFNNYDISSHSQRVLEQEIKAEMKPEKCLGQRIIASVFRTDEQENNDDLGNIAEESQILPDNESNSDASHFIEANLEFSAQNNERLQENSINQKQYVITISKTKDKGPVLSPSSKGSPTKLQLPHPTLGDSTGLSKLKGVQVSGGMLGSRLGGNRTKEVQQSNVAVRGSMVKGRDPLESRMIQSKIINTGEADIDVGPDRNRQQPPACQRTPDGNGEKKLSLVQVPNRMKSSFDPKVAMSQFKTASNGGNFSEPDKHMNKQPQAKTVFKNMQQSQYSEEKNLKNMQFRDHIQQTIIHKLNSLEKAVVNLKESSSKNQDIEEEKTPPIRMENSKKISKEEKSQQNKLKISHKIQTMKNLAPEQLFSGFSSIDSQEKEKRKIASKGQPNQQIISQINTLKQKIEELQRKASSNLIIEHPQQKSPKHKHHQAHFYDDESSRKPLQVNFKDYNQTSLARVLKRNKSENNHIYQHSMNHELSDDLDHKFNIEVPAFDRIPRPNDSLQKVVELGIFAFETFSIPVGECRSMDMMKFKDGVQFHVPEKSLLLCWEYSGKFYLGKCSSKNFQQVLEKEGEGIQIVPNSYVYRGEFSRNMKNENGTINYSNGEKYQGQWKNDLYNGKGVLISKESKYQGSFTMGKKQGFGKEMFINGDIYVGDYEEGRFQGQGKYIWKNQTNYKGEFRGGFMEGDGVWKSPNGDVYEGSYFRNMKHGFGTYRWRNGKVFSGKFEHGNRISKRIQSKNTIAAEKEITYDQLSNDQSQLYEKRTDAADKKTSNKRFTIRTLQQIVPERRKSSKQYTFHCSKF